MPSPTIKEIRIALYNSQSNLGQMPTSFFKTGPGEYAEHDQFIGVSVPQLRRIAKQFQNSVLSDIQELLRSTINEERLLALFILIYQYEKAYIENKKRLYQFYCDNIMHVNNWNLVDSSAYQIVGNYLYDKDREFLFELAKSDNLWKRRIAIVSTLFFIRKNDFSSTLQIAQILILDSHDLIHKAVGWMLREVGKRNKGILLAFLKEHKRVMAKVMFRYAIERLNSVDINNFKNNK
jgi:3-methyladenine DNA glycosylase AlkD